MPLVTDLYELDIESVDVFLELKEKREYVGRLSEAKEKGFVFQYDSSFIRSHNAFAIGPNLLLSDKPISRESLFPEFVDRIPSRRNAAYPEYCESVGISVEERNPMILLPSLGRRGPSDFIIERVFVLQDEIIPQALRRILEEVPLSQNDLALALDIPITTLWRILKGSSKDESLLRLIHLYLENTDLWRVLLQFTRGKITQKKYGLLNQYLKQIKAEKIGA